MSIPQLPFVGRSPELSALGEFLDRVHASDGGTFVVEGPLGIGKTSLIEEFSRIAEGRGAHGLLIGTCTCSPYASALNPSAPFAELLASMRDSRQRKLGQIAWRTIRETAPDWLATIPIVGPFVSAGAKTVRTIVTRPAVGAESAFMADTLMNQWVSAMQALVEQGLTLVLIVEDAQWLARPAYELLSVMSERVVGKAGVVVTYDRHELEPDRPLEAEVSRLQLRAGGERLRLPPLGTDELASALQLAFGSELHHLLPAWLQQFCGGNPLVIENYLGFLQRKGEIRLEPQPWISASLSSVIGSWAMGHTPSKAELPPAPEQMVQLRLEQLPEEQLELLRAATMQGTRFSADLVSLVTGQSADRELRRVERRSGLVVRLEADEPLFPDGDVYRFDSGITQRVIYSQMGPKEQRRRHLSTADALAGLTPSTSADLQTSLGQIARHRLDAGDRWEAARSFLAAGESAYDGGRLLDAVELSWRAYANSSGDSMLVAASGLLVLKSSEPWWGTPLAVAETVWGLLDTTLEAAFASGEDSLIAQALLTTASYFRERGEQEPARVLMRRAASLADSACDDTVRLVALSELGYAVSPVNLGEGLEVLWEAEKLYLGRFQSASAEERRRYALLQSYIGVGEFDAGRFGNAKERLEAALGAMEELEMKADLPRGLSFMGQLQMAIGAFDEAGSTFRKGAELLATTGSGAGLSAYNRALLGKLWLERGEPQLAREELDQAAKVISRLPHVDLELSVRLYNAELLIEEGYYERAGSDCEWVAGTSVAAGYAGFLAMARSFAALAHWREGSLGQALNASTAALKAVAVGEGPVLARTEEVLLRHAQILCAAGFSTDAEPILRRAHQIVMAKASSLRNPHSEARFLSLPISAQIIQGPRSA